MLARPHPCLGWLHISPADPRRVMERLIRDRDAALEADPTSSGMPQAFVDWTWSTWLPAHMGRYEAQIEAHIAYLDTKLASLNQELEQLAGGVLDDRDAAAELRERLKRELSAKQLAS